jgi:hypothetical protein
VGLCYQVAGKGWALQKGNRASIEQDEDDKRIHYKKIITAEGMCGVINWDKMRTKGEEIDQKNNCGQ